MSGSVLSCIILVFNHKFKDVKIVRTCCTSFGLAMDNVASVLKLVSDFPSLQNAAERPQRTQGNVLHVRNQRQLLPQHFPNWAVRTLACGALQPLKIHRFKNLACCGQYDFNLHINGPDWLICHEK